MSTLARESFINLLHPIQPFKLGIKTFAAKMAIKMDIQLIIYGEPYAEYGSADYEQTDSPTYNEDWFVNDQEIYIGGLSTSEIIKKHNFINEVDLKCYMPLKSQEVKNHNLNVEFWVGILDGTLKRYIIMQLKIVDMKWMIKELMVHMEDILE